MPENHVGIGIETVYDTLVPPTVWYELLSEAVRREPGYQPINTIRSIGPRAYSLGSVVTRGPIRFGVNFQELPGLLYMFFGDVDTVGGTPNEHTIPGATPFAAALARKNLSIEVQRDRAGAGTTHQYSGCQLAELGLTVAIDEQPEASVQIIGSGTEVNSSPNSPSYRDFDLVQPTQATFKFDGVTTYIERFEVRQVWPTTEPRALGLTKFASQPRAGGPLTVEGSFVLLEHNAAVWAKFSTYAEGDLQLAATNGVESLTLNMNYCVLRQATPGVDGPTAPKPTVEFSARLDPALDCPVQWVCENDQATLP